MMHRLAYWLFPLALATASCTPYNKAAPRTPGQACTERAPDCHGDLGWVQGSLASPR